MTASLCVEGHGEVEAVGNLITRLWREIGGVSPWGRPRRTKNLHLRSGVELAAERARLMGASALLVLRDADEGCPKDLGPEAATWLRALQLPFPAAFVLFKPEYEVLFLPCLERMVGKMLPGRRPGLERPGLRPETRWSGDWERHRGVKEWLGRHFREGRSYKPTTDQLALTRWIDFRQLREAHVPCFATLERALRFLQSSDGQAGAVYPPASNPDGR